MQTSLNTYINKKILSNESSYIKEFMTLKFNHLITRNRKIYGFELLNFKTVREKLFVD